MSDKEPAPENKLIKTKGPFFVKIKPFIACSALTQTKPALPAIAHVVAFQVELSCGYLPDAHPENQPMCYFRIRHQLNP